MRIENRVLFLLLSLALAVGAASAATPEEERILVTDPELLELMGAAPGQEVYLWSKGSYSDRLAGYLGRPGNEARPDGVERRPQSSATFGTGVAYHAVSARMFQARTSGGFTRGLTVGGGEVACLAASDPFIDAQVQIPSGALASFLDVFGSDTCAENMEIFLLEFCLPDFSPAVETFTTLGSVSTLGASGDFFVFTGFPAGTTIDNTSCHYVVRARFDDSTISCDCGLSLVLNKARVEFVRQVSPAPAVATFLDVPPSHPYFEEIEAMAAAGLVSFQCEPGKFCPDEVPTRKELAVLIARALGLHWVFF